MKLLIGIVLLTLAGFAGGAAACDLPTPGGPVILTVEGQIERCNAGLEVQFDIAMLEALPKHQVTTENPWDKGKPTYDGVLLRDLLSFVKANGTVLEISALNDYSAELPVADVQKINVILSYKRNGEYLLVPDKGPLFVVFPFSDNPALQSEERHVQSVWQVSRIAVK